MIEHSCLWCGNKTNFISKHKNLGKEKCHKCKEVGRLRLHYNLNKFNNYTTGFRFEIEHTYSNGKYKSTHSIKTKERGKYYSNLLKKTKEDMMENIK